jgi:hypothetical protein
MIRLKLNLPEATVSYNETGALLGSPVEHTPNQIKNYSLPFEITGYVSKNDFLAYSLYSSARKFTVSEQLALLTSLGFKTVPYFENENSQGNQLITIKNQYSMYDAYWISLPTGKEFKVPELAHINSVKYVMAADKTLTLVCTTDKGEFEVIDMKLIAYFQPGCTAKIWNGEIQPMNTAPVVAPIPQFCPKCNNPLKRIQIYPDLPMFYKCTSSFCDQLVLDEDQDTPIEDESAEIERTVSTSDEFDGTKEKPEVAETANLDIINDKEAEVTNPLKCYVDIKKLDAAEVDELVVAGKIQIVDEIDDADCILVKSKLAVSKIVRSLSKEFNKELKPITDFQ